MSWDPQSYANHAAFVPALGGAAFDLLAPQAGERILDLGCGDGVLTARLVAAGARVVGVDADAAMVAAAKDKGLDARRIDGRALPFDAEFDAVFSNAALHWMGNPAPVTAGVFRALKPGGRYVGEFGGFREYRRDPRRGAGSADGARLPRAAGRGELLPYRGRLPRRA